MRTSHLYNPFIYMPVFLILELFYFSHCLHMFYKVEGRYLIETNSSLHSSWRVILLFAGISSTDAGGFQNRTSPMVWFFTSSSAAIFNCFTVNFKNLSDRFYKETFGDCLSAFVSLLWWRYILPDLRISMWLSSGSKADCTPDQRRKIKYCRRTIFTFFLQ